MSNHDQYPVVPPNTFLPSAPQPQQYDSEVFRGRSLSDYTYILTKRK
jgi:hypothetical protein